MMHLFIKYLFPVFFLFVAQSPAEKITVHMIGDSTMADKEIKSYPETGWGTPFSVFFDSSVTVINHAKNGRSTKSFREEGRWQPVIDNLQEGDYVFIQFGHNDEVKSKVGRYTTPDEFKANLTRYIEETRSNKANPILLTPVARRKFDNAGKLVDTHEVYSSLVRDVAKRTNTPLIDADKLSQELLLKFGPEQSRLLFMHLEKGEHPNYPDGREDDTHFNELGARKIAELVLAEMKKLNIPLIERTVNYQK